MVMGDNGASGPPTPTKWFDEDLGGVGESAGSAEERDDIDWERLSSSSSELEKESVDEDCENTEEAEGEEWPDTGIRSGKATSFMIFDDQFSTFSSSRPTQVRSGGRMRTSPDEGECDFARETLSTDE